MNGDGSMKKKHTGLIIAATSIFMTALMILNLFVFNSCMSKAKKYAAENMLAILQTIRINMQSRKYDEGRVAKAQTEVIFTAIENSNKETFKALFSQKALADCGDADEQIDDFMERFGGKITSWEYFSMSASGNVEYGEYKQSEIWSRSEFECDGIIYTMFFHMFPIDVNNPENVGIYNIFITADLIYDEMLYETRKIIMYPEMAEHPIIWIYEG